MLPLFLFGIHCSSVYAGSKTHLVIRWLYKKSSFSKIRVAYNNFYRKLLHVSGRSSANAMFVENNIPNFESVGTSILSLLG